MQHLPQGVKDEEGCFVYQVVGGASIRVRSTLTVADEGKTELSFCGGDLVSVDRIRPSRLPESQNGPFLRLSDASGWLFEKEQGETKMKRVKVHTGLWRFYVDNVPVGIGLRKHPTDRQSLRVKDVDYLPMQKIFCDRKVMHPTTGVCFYRVQGTEGWVFDRRPLKRDENGKVVGSLTMLLDEDEIQIQRGLFVYEALCPQTFRIKPSTSEQSKLDRQVKAGQLVSVDIIRQSTSSEGDGPFLRLADGSGWLFECKEQNEVLRQVAIREGAWEFQVMYPMQLRRQPIDSSRFLDDEAPVFKPGSNIRCTHKVQASSGVCFYRVEWTNGWVFDKRGGQEMLKPIAKSKDKPSFTATSKHGWSPDFVRGVAATVDGIIEVAFDETSRVLSFQSSPEQIRINVYYTTQTIVTALSHPTRGPKQHFRTNCSTEDLSNTLQHPRLALEEHWKKGDEIRMDSPKAQVMQTSQYGNADKEEEDRKTLLGLDDEISKLMEKRLRCLANIRDVDLVRHSQAKEAQAKYFKRLGEWEEREQEEVRNEQRTWFDCG